MKNNIEKVIQVLEQSLGKSVLTTTASPASNIVLMAPSLEINAMLDLATIRSREVIFSRPIGCESLSDQTIAQKLDIESLQRFMSHPIDESFIPRLVPPEIKELACIVCGQKRSSPDFLKDYSLSPHLRERLAQEFNDAIFSVSTSNRTVFPT